MLIIDSKKDFYDYLQGVLGRDEKVVYDRRGSTVVGPSDCYVFGYPMDYDLYFSNKPFRCDEPKKRIKGWHSKKYEYRKNKWGHFKYNNYIEEGSIYFLMLEVGYYQFIFEVERYLDKDGNLKKDISLVEKKMVDKNDKKTDKPMCICRIDYEYIQKYDISKKIINPILKNTWIPKFIPAQDMWNMLYEYISSLNDKEFTDTRTNEQHIESHGFDKKISFRKRNL